MASYTYELAELGDDAHGLGCKCCRFSNGIDLPIPKKLSRAEIQQYALKFSTSIFSDWAKLNAVLKRFEAPIRKRWLRKNIKQRRDILLTAWPDMAPCHHPDFDGFRKSKKIAPRSRTCPSQAYLWPCINLEDLQQHNPLLLFINTRGRNHPGKLISADIEAAHLGHGWDFDLEEEGDALQFFDRYSPRSYGKLCSIHEPSPKGEQGLAGYAIMHHPNVGLLGLEIQAGIYNFLLLCTRLILHDIEPCQYFFLAPHQPTPPTLEPKRNGFTTLQDHALEAPYLAPQKLNLDRLKRLVTARRALAEDHVWQLREDPGYFVETLKEEKEHDQEYNHQCSGTWEAVAGNMLADAFTYFFFWDDIYRRIKKMPSIERQLKRADQDTVRLYPQDELLWAELDTIVNLMILIPSMRLLLGLPVSPRMRHCYPLAGSPNIAMKDRWALKPGRSEAERRVDIVFHALTHREPRKLHVLHHLVQEAQYMLDTEPSANELIDSWLTGHFSDLALLSELKLCIDNLEPWSSGWRAAGVADTCAVVDSVGLLLDYDAGVRMCILNACDTTENLGDPNGADWRYPADKRPVKENILQMRKTERRLDALWKDIHELVPAMEIAAVRGLKERKLHRTPKWKEPTIILSATKTDVAAVLRACDTNIFRSQPDTDDTCMPKKAKVKTRKSPASPSTPAPDLTPAIAPGPNPAPVHTVKVPKRAYRVLSVLLPGPTADEHQRTEVGWDEMLHALNTIGLRPEKLYGSVWIFQKSVCKIDLDLKRSIQFHEPKQVRRGSKIPSIMVRRFGRRLKHTFGWEGGMFECE